MAKEIRQLPIAPDSANPATFNARADAFVKAMQPFADDANALAKELEEFSANVDAKSGDVDTKYADLVQKYNDFITKYGDFFAKYDIFVPAYADIGVKHGEVKTNKEHVDLVKTQIDEALQKAKDMINENGIIDDSKTSAVSTFSSSKIDEGYVPKEKTSANMKIYGKGIKQESENDSVVTRDDEGYILHTKPASAEFSSSHTLCVKGADNKEKFATLETIYAKRLKNIIEQDFSPRVIEFFDVCFERSLPYSATHIKILKNGDVFVYSTREENAPYAIFSGSDFSQKSLAVPNVVNKQFFCVQTKSDIFLAHRYGAPYKLVDNNGTYSWQQIPIPAGATLQYTGFEQYCNEHFYANINNEIYKYTGSWTKTGIKISTPNRYDILMFNDQKKENYNTQQRGAFTISGDQDILVLEDTAFDLTRWRNYDGTDGSFWEDRQSGKKNIVFTKEFNVQKKYSDGYNISVYGTDKAYELPFANSNLYSVSALLKKGGEYYVFGNGALNGKQKSGVLRINKKLLKYYGAI